MITEKDLLNYLQNQMDDFKRNEEKFGMDRETEKKLEAMIACKEMVESLIQKPVNLGRDGKVWILS